MKALDETGWFPLQYSNIQRQVQVQVRRLFLSNQNRHWPPTFTGRFRNTSEILMLCKGAKYRCAIEVDYKYLKDGHDYRTQLNWHIFGSICQEDKYREGWLLIADVAFIKACNINILIWAVKFYKLCNGVYFITLAEVVHDLWKKHVILCMRLAPFFENSCS